MSKHDGLFAEQYVAPYYGHIFETEKRTRHRILTSTQRCNGGFLCGVVGAGRVE